MSCVVPGLLVAGLLLSSGWAHAQGALPKAAAPKPQPTSRAKALAAAQPSNHTAPSPNATPATAPSASPARSTPPKDAEAAKRSEASPVRDTQGDPTTPSTPTTPVGPNAASASPAAPSVRVYMRSGSDPLLFSARAKNDDGTPTLCSAPCDANLLPGDYQLRLNGVVVEGPVKLARPGTLQGKLESREASRESGWLALNVGGIIGGVFITVAALGGPSWTYVAGGGSLLSGGVIFVLTYRADRASVSFTPGDPVDVRGLPPPVPAQDNGSGPTPNASLDRSGSGVGVQARGLGVRIAF